VRILADLPPGSSPPRKDENENKRAMEKMNPETDLSILFFLTVKMLIFTIS
jgi:hypothetical protein